PLSHLGAAAPCGLVRYESDVFGGDYRDNLFACCFNMHKVTRHVLEPAGATFKSTDSDFLVSDNLDFHPTDVQEDADGSLIVVDTGGWYKLCCPTSQLHKPDVLGAIYRVRGTGARRVEDPRGSEIAWAKMNADKIARFLADARPAVRRRAISELADRGPAALPVLSRVILSGVRESKVPTLTPSDSAAVEMQRNAVWALTRIDHEKARELTVNAAAAFDETVRLAALHSISLWRDRKGVGILVDALANEPRNPSHRRVAA